MRFYKTLISFLKDHKAGNDQIKVFTADFLDTYFQFFQMIAKRIQTDAIRKIG
jgi:hypothetical protein